jgi:hypothetical protein
MFLLCGGGGFPPVPPYAFGNGDSPSPALFPEIFASMPAPVLSFRIPSFKNRIRKSSLLHTDKIFPQNDSFVAYQVKGMMPLQGYWGQRPQGLI